MTNTRTIADPFAQSKRSVRFAVGFFALGLLCVLFPELIHPERMALTLVIVGVMLGFLALRGRQQTLDYFEIFIPFSLMHLIGFGLAAIALTYYPELATFRNLVPYLTPALVLGVVGYLAFVAGYASLTGPGRPTKLSRLRVRSSLAIYATAVIGAVGFGARILIERRAWAGMALSAGLSLLNQFAPVFFFAWFLGWHRLFWLGAKRAVLPLLFLLPFAVGILAYTLGGKQLAITMAGIPMIAFYYTRRRLPLRAMLVLLVLAVFVIFPIYNAYRWTSRKQTISNRLEVTAQRVQRWDSEMFVDRSVFAFVGRLATITSTAAVVRDVPRWVDYKYGETLFLAPISVLIPRFVWPDKPTVTIGREFGVTFGLVSLLDKETQVASSWVGELYWNFQYPGVLVGMFLIGMLYRWVYRKIGIGEREESVRQAVYIVMMLSMMQAEGDLAANMAGLVKLVVILFVMVRALEWIHAVEAVPHGQSAA